MSEFYQNYGFCMYYFDQNVHKARFYISKRIKIRYPGVNYHLINGLLCSLPYSCLAGFNSCLAGFI